MFPRQTMSLGDTLLQLLFRFIVNTLYGAYLPRSYVRSDGLLHQHFPENLLLLLLLLWKIQTELNCEEDTATVTMSMSGGCLKMGYKFVIGIN